MESQNTQNTQTSDSIEKIEIKNKIITYIDISSMNSTNSTNIPTTQKITYDHIINKSISSDNLRNDSKIMNINYVNDKREFENAIYRTTLFLPITSLE